MIVISFGLTKSGSTLAFEMAKAVLELNGYPQPRLADGLVSDGHGINFTDSWSEEELERLVACTPGTCVVVKTHGTPSLLSPGRVLDHIVAGDIKIHIVYRDPRDMVLSMVDHGLRARAQGEGTGSFSNIGGVDDALASLRRQLGRMRDWVRFPSLKLMYEDFAFDPIAGPTLIASELNLTADPQVVWEMVSDRFTQKNVGRPNRHVTEMTPEDAARVERALPGFVERVIERRDFSWFDSL